MNKKILLAVLVVIMHMGMFLVPLNQYIPTREPFEMFGVGDVVRIFGDTATFGEVFNPFHYLTSTILLNLTSGLHLGMKYFALIFHLVNVYLLYSIAKKNYSETWSLLAAALFALHPVHTEIMQWTTRSASMLGVTCALVAWNYCNTSWTRTLLLSAAVFYSPFSAIIAIYLLLQERASIHTYVTSVCVVVSIFLSKIMASSYAVTEHIAILLNAFLHYFIRLIVPFRYDADSQLTHTLFALGGTATLTVTLVALCVAIGIFFHSLAKMYKTILPLMVLYGMLLSSLLFHAGLIVADYRLYPVLIFVALGFVHIISNYKSSLTIPLTITLILFSSLGTMHIVHAWNNPLELWQEKNEMSEQALRLRGTFLYEAQEYAEAKVMFQKIIDEYEPLAGDYSLLSKSIYETEGINPAIQVYVDALRANRHDLLLYTDLASIYFTARDFDRAGIILDEAMRQYPQDADLVYFRAEVYRHGGLFLEASNTYTKVHEMKPFYKRADLDATASLALYNEHGNVPELAKNQTLVFVNE